MKHVFVRGVRWTVKQDSGTWFAYAYHGTGKVRHSEFYDSPLQLLWGLLCESSSIAAFGSEHRSSAA